MSGKIGARLLVAAGVLAAVIAAGANIGFVKKVLSGDLVQIGDSFLARLTGIRAPERTEPFGNEIYDFARKELEGQTVKLITWTKDNTAAGIVYDEQGYARVQIFYGRQSAVSFNEVLLKKGYARIDLKYLPDSLKHYITLEKEARDKGLGIWANAGYSIFDETMVDMAWPEVEKAAKEGAVVLMTTAVIEEHGPHMACGIDTYLGYFLCKLTRRELESRGVRAVIAPPLFWGVNSATHVFPGTFAVRPETMKALLADIFASLKSMGFRHVFNINAHGDGQHKRAAIQAILEAQKATGLDIRYLVSENDIRQLGLTGEPPSWVLLHKAPPEGGAGSPYLDIHAGAGETGLVAAFFPGLVDLPMAKTLAPTRLQAQQVGEWLKDARKTTPLGYFGDPASYNIEDSRAYVQEWCRMMAEAIAAYLGAGAH
jgi:creatinine amidohydrolase